MQKISTQAVITSVTSKADGSLGLRLGTPELSPTEKAVFMELQGLNLNILVTPLDFETKEILEVKSEVDRKTPSQRLRAILFLLWKQEGEHGEFSAYYNNKMSRIIDQLKSRLESEE